MSRRKKPCEFCESEWRDSTEGSNGFQGEVEWYPDNGLFAVTAFANDESGESQEYNLVSVSFEYCPVCGRKVGY